MITLHRKKTLFTYFLLNAKSNMSIISQYIPQKFKLVSNKIRLWNEYQMFSKYFISTYIGLLDQHCIGYEMICTFMFVLSSTDAEPRYRRLFIVYGYEAPARLSYQAPSPRCCQGGAKPELPGHLYKNQPVFFINEKSFIL